MKPKPKKMTVTEYAAHRGVTRDAVSKAIKKGRLGKAVKKSGRKTEIDVATADVAFEANTDKSKQNYVGRGGQGKAQLASGGEIPGSYNQANTAAKIYQAKLLKMEFDEKSGKLVNADEVKAEVFNMCRATRDALLSVPDRLVPVLIGMTDSHAMHQAITAEMRKICEDMARTRGNVSL